MESISYHLSKLQNKLERFFEDEPFSTDETFQIQANFQIQTASSYLNKLNESLPVDEVDRTAVLFSRFVPLFEFGVLLFANPPPARIVATFDRGILKTMKPSQSKVSPQDFATVIPDILKLPYFEFLAPKSNILKSKIDHLFPAMRSDDRLLMVRIGPQAAFVLSTTLAEPWLGIHLGNVHEAFLPQAGPR